MPRRKALNAFNRACMKLAGPADAPMVRDVKIPGMTKRIAVKIPPEELQEYCQESIARSPSPTWRDDPTYHLRKKP